MSSLGEKHPKLIYKSYNTLIQTTLTGDGEKLQQNFDNNFNIHCQNVSISTSYILLQSQGSYGGKLNLGGTYMVGIKSPFRVDNAAVQCSLSFTPTYQQLKNIIRFLQKRNKSIELKIYTGNKSQFIYFDECYIENISIQVTRDQFLKVDVKLYVRQNYQRINECVGGMFQQEDYRENKQGHLEKYSDEKLLGGIKYLSERDNLFIPYYATGVISKNFDYDLDNRIQGWSINFTQNILKKTLYHQNNRDKKQGPLPNYLMFGVLEIQCNLNVLVSDRMLTHNDLLFSLQFDRAYTGDSKTTERYNQFFSGNDTNKNYLDENQHKLQFVVYTRKTDQYNGRYDTEEKDKLFQLSSFQLNGLTPDITNDIYTVSLDFNAYGLKLNN